VGKRAIPNDRVPAKILLEISERRGSAEGARHKHVPPLPESDFLEKRLFELTPPHGDDMCQLIGESFAFPYRNP
jgi:hypothetical protein